jgi:hypothetical protein
MLVLSSTAAPAAATLPLFLPQAPPDKVSGLIHAATLLAQLLGQGRAADSGALRSAMETVFCGSDAGRRVGVEGRLRGPRGGAGVVPAQVRRGDAHTRGLGRRLRIKSGAGYARDADAARRTSAVADPAFGGIRTAPAILDADTARLRRRPSGSTDAGRPRPRAFGRHGPAGDLRRARESAAGA